MPSRFETREPDWLSFDAALESVLNAVHSTDASLRPLGEALGLAVAETIYSPLTLPPELSSHMDGYALRAGDVRPERDGHAIPLLVVGTSRPGHPWDGELPEGAAVRIMTGGLLPTGADTVVPVEHTDREHGSPNHVRISGPDGEGPVPERGRYVRPAGEEVRKGAELARPGDTVSPGMLALLAHTGAPRVPTHRPPRVGLVVTGDELVDAGDPDALRGGIRRADILSPVLPALVRQAGGDPLSPVRAPDELGALEETLREVATRADLVVTTGGASMGETDLVKRALDRLGFTLEFWRARIRPGSPVSLGGIPRDGGAPLPVIGLPGNPVSAVTTFFLFAIPAIRAAGGHTRTALPSVRVTARDRFGGPATLTRFFRVRLEPEGGGRWGASLTGSQGSGVIPSLALADGLAVVPDGVDSIEPGTELAVILLPHPGWPRNR